MPFWSSQTLRKRIPAEQLIEPYDASRVVHSAYEMGVGTEAFVTSSPSDSTQLPADKKVVLPPGQFGLLVTHESVYVPTKAIAFISIRARIKFQGLINVSGFHVDPGFRGKLKFAVYNAGSHNIVLDQGQAVFMIWFADLDEIDDSPYLSRQPPKPTITAEDVSKIEGIVASPAELRRQLDELKADVEKKFHATEYMRLTNRHLLQALLVAALALWTKSCFDSSSNFPVASSPSSFTIPVTTKDSESAARVPAVRAASKPETAQVHTSPRDTTLLPPLPSRRKPPAPSRQPL